MPKRQEAIVELSKTRTLSSAATFGSSVRVKGLVQELRARLGPASRKSLAFDGNDVILSMPESEKIAFNAALVIVNKAMAGIENLPIIPREIQDILGINAGERHRWLADGRLPSAGTRTVRLNGRARQITFYVFDPKVVEDLLDRGAADEWRVEDAEAKAERRRLAARRGKLTRTLKKARDAKIASPRQKVLAASPLKGWDEFEIDGLLR